MKQTNQTTGTRLHAAIDRLLASDDELIGAVTAAREAEPRGIDQPESAWRARVADRLIRSSARSAMVSGGVTALPGLLPGVGTLAAFAGGALGDVIWLLKTEVELSLQLCHLYGLDIRDERERQLAFVLASVQTYRSADRKGAAREVAEAEIAALWQYGPRELGRLAAQHLAKVVALKGLRTSVRLLPVVGVVAAAGLNGALTKRVGNAIRDTLEQRAQMA